MHRLTMRWTDTRSRTIFKLTLLSVIIFVSLQIVELFVTIHYNAIPHYLHRSITADNIIGKLIQVNIPFSTDPTLEGYTWLQCKCGDKRNLERNVSYSQSTCSREATEIGFGQRVISYSLFISDRDAVPFFLDGIVLNLDKLNDIYPGWLVRIYTNVPINNHSCPLICDHSNLFWCNINNIPGLGDLSDVNGRVWRFLPFGDPNVDIFLSRDLDSLPTMRERAAVLEWENFNKTFHVMRDSQWHKTQILAGMWGAKNTLLDTKIGNKLRAQVIEDGKRNKTKFWDQRILQKHVFFPFSKDVLAHDSFFCGEFEESLTLPFPTKRVGQEFVGHDTLKEENTLFVGLIKSCPVKCRPLYGQDWKYC